MKQVSIIADAIFNTLSNNLTWRLKTVKGLWFLLLPAFFGFSLSSCQKERIQSVNQPGSHQISSSNTSESAQSEAAQPKSVTFTLLMDFSTNPAFGTFTARGALNTAGTAEFDFSPNQNFVTAHNVITLTTADGTITIHDECEFAVSNAFPFGRGSYQIVSGTGAYANIMGSGAESFPSSTEDILSGTIY
jgi:hypothetical protein